MKNHLNPKVRCWLGVFCLAVMTLPLPAQVVVNEIFYNAPDDLDDLQWIELYNNAEQPADLSGWTIDDGKIYTFPSGTTLDARGYVIVALNTNRFTEFYSERAQGPLRRPLKRSGERLHLKDASGKVIDVARYKDRSPWPVSADGYSASVERICPTANGDTADNWAASPLPPTPKPSGTPGRQNARFSATLPPSLNVDPAAQELGPGQPLPVSVTVQGNARTVELLYRVIAEGAEDRESVLPMAQALGSRYRGIIPPQTAGSLIRYRVKAIGKDGSVRFSPDEQELRPSLSVYVHEPWDKGNIPSGTKRARTLLALGLPEAALAWTVVVRGRTLEDSEAPTGKSRDPRAARQLLSSWISRKVLPRCMTTSAPFRATTTVASRFSSTKITRWQG
jgi:hypothetical protein